MDRTFLQDWTFQVIVVADTTMVILIDFAGDKNNELNYLRNQISGCSCGFLYVFDMCLLVLALWQSTDLRISSWQLMSSYRPP